MMGINNILIEITTKGSIYDEIINNLITPRFDLKPELISEISISFLENKEKIEDVYERGYFKYYFINTVKNQIHSNTSSFHKNNRLQNYEMYDEYLDIIDDTDIDVKIEFEERLDLVDKLYSNTKKSWFQERLWQEYFTNGKTYRQIEKEYSLDHVLVWHNIKQVKEKIKRQIK